MIYYKTAEEIEKLRTACLLVCKTLTHVASKIAPGVKGADLDREAEALIRDHGAIPGFKGLYDFPATLCISINNQVVHGVPSEIPFKNGDIVSIDCGTIVDGYYGDAAYTFCLGEVEEDVMQLCRATKTSLYLAIDNAIVGKRLGDIGYAVQNFVEREHKYSVVRDLVGHGVGKELHEEPQVPNFGKRGKGIKLRENLVIAIEPMVNLGKKDVRQLKDGTVYTRDKKPSAHYEHTVAVKSNKADILSDHKPIEAAILKNPDVREVESLLELAV